MITSIGKLPIFRYELWKRRNYWPHCQRLQRIHFIWRWLCFSLYLEEGWWSNPPSILLMCSQLTIRLLWWLNNVNAKLMANKNTVSRYENCSQNFLEIEFWGLSFGDIYGIWFQTKLFQHAIRRFLFVVGQNTWLWYYIEFCRS